MMSDGMIRMHDEIKLTQLNHIYQRWNSLNDMSWALSFYLKINLKILAHKHL